VIAGYLLGPQRLRFTLTLLGCWALARLSFLLWPGSWLALICAAAFATGLAWKVLPRFLGAAKKWVLRGLWGKSELTVREAGKLAVAKHTLHLSLLSPCILLILPRSGQAMTPLPAVHPPTTPF